MPIFGKVKIDGALCTVTNTPQSTVNTGAAAIQLKAAGGAGKRQFVLGYRFVNKTAGEYPVVELTEDHGGTPVKLDTIIPHSPGGAAGMGEAKHEYTYPIEFTAAKTLGFQLQSATGDVYGHVVVAVED